LADGGQSIKSWNAGGLEDKWVAAGFYYELMHYDQDFRLPVKTATSENRCAP
jgi:hypothetical protein